jgi:hypothetical protein
LEASVNIRRRATIRRPTRWTFLIVSWLFLLAAAAPARAQVATLGKGWLLNSGGSITSTPAEVISGRNSIKGSNSSVTRFVSFLVTDTTFVQFAPGQSYTITFKYRVQSALSDGVQYGFFSNQPAGNPTTGLPGGTGSGTASATLALGPQTDFRVEFKMIGTGTIVIDDLQITNGTGQLVASENAEGPSLVAGPLNFQLTDAMTLFPPGQASALATTAKDLDGDDHPETLLSLYGLPSCGVPLQPIVIESSGQMRLAASDFFPAGVPTTNCTPMILFADINNDGLPDVLFAEAGLDAPPWTGSRIGVALNLGGGKFRDVSSLIPADQQTTRSYAIAVGDVLSDGHVEIILPDEVDGANTALLRWNGNGFDEIRNWIPQSIWKDAPAYLHAQSWMNLADFDLDGKQDLLVTGQDHNPNFQIVFGATGGFTAANLVALTDGPFGHTPGGPQPDGTVATAEVSPVVVADFNNDALPDIFAVVREETELANFNFVVGNSTYAVRLNQGARKFIDASPLPFVNLGRVEYQNLIAIDLNNDGFLDVVGTYSTDPPAATSPQWGTTVFLNDGTGAFQVVDGLQFLAVTTTPSNGKQWNLGSFVPTIVNPQRTEGIAYQSVGGCGTPGGCPAVGLNLYKVVANSAFGTGPNFADPARLGAPGFNEFYYLNHYPDAAAAVQSGQFRTGLDHYLAFGAAKGYRPHAVTNAIPQGVSLWSDNKAFRVTYQDDGNVVIYDTNRKPLRFTNTAGTSPGTFVMQSDGNLVLRDGQNVVRWQSGTTGNPGASFGLQGDGNLVIFSAKGTPIWGAYGR